MKKLLLFSILLIGQIFGNTEDINKLKQTIKNPKSAPKDISKAQFDLANLYNQKKDYNQAFKYLKLVANDKNVDPKILSQAQFGLGQFYNQKGDYSNAIKYLTLVVNTNPSNIDPKILAQAKTGLKELNNSVNQSLRNLTNVMKYS